jgi:hypothetical protein
MKASERVWSELTFDTRPDVVAVRGLLEHLGSSANLGELTFEVRAAEGPVRYLVGSDREHRSAVNRLISMHLRGSSLRELSVARQYPRGALTLRPSRRGLPLRSDAAEAVTLSVLSALSAVRAGEELILQLTLGRRHAPEIDENQPHYANLYRALMGQPAQIPGPERTRARAKRAVHGFDAQVRLGAWAANETRTHGLLRALAGALRTLEAPGVQLMARRVSPAAVAAGGAIGTWSQTFLVSTTEAVGLLGWPVGDGYLPGQPPLHPKRIPVPSSVPTARHPFAVAAADGLPAARRVGLSRVDSLTHAVLIGGTGSGKSVLMSHLILDAIEDGRSVLVVDPKGDLITRELLPRIPAHRHADVVVIDPMSDLPVGINPFAEGGSAELIADGLLAVFKTVYKDSWGPRLEDILSSALLTLARVPGSTLAMLPALLTDPAVRKRLTKNLHDPVGLEPFWKSYEAYSPEQRAQVIAPVLNKLRPYLLRSSLRRTLGQAQPKFNLSELFTKRRIILVNLNKGLLGAEGSRLLGSLVVSQLWPLILGRAAIAPEQRHVVNVFIDEVQDYLALPTDLADAFAQARGLGVGFIVAHQYRRQLPAALLAGLDSNAKTTITFALDPHDAGEIAKRTPALLPDDFMALDKYEIYLNLMNDGRATGWFSARTLAGQEAITDGGRLLRESLERYGRTGRDVDAEIERALGIDDATMADEAIGRRPKGDRP